MSTRLLEDHGQGGADAPPALWDPIVRISHWGVAAIVLANGVFNKGGGTLHIWLGWIGMALLALRLIWGVIGTPEARFSAFPPNPKAALSHLADLVGGRPRDYASHNPAGALMVYAFWAMLCVVIASGLVMTDGVSPMRIADQQAAVAAGDWSVLVTEDDGAEDGNSGEEAGEWIKEMHEIAANLLLLLAVLHVAAVVLETRAMRRNLVAPMIIGRR